MLGGLHHGRVATAGCTPNRPPLRQQFPSWAFAGCALSSRILNERPIPSLLTVLKLEAMHDCVTRGSTLEAATLRLEIIKKGRTKAKILSPDSTRDGQEGVFHGAALCRP